MTLHNGVCFWSMSPSKYVQEAFNNCEIHLKEYYDGKYNFWKEATNHFSYEYETKVNVSEPPDLYMASYYQFIIGIM